MSSKSFVYRPLTGSDPQAAIGAALARYHKRYGIYPPSIVVNRKREGDARAVLSEAVEALTKASKAAPGTQVVTNGGTLLNEVWLEVEAQ